MNWNQHVAIVTGAGSGIGQGIAEGFAEVGAHVVIAEVNRERGEAVAEACREQYGQGIFAKTDVSRSEDCRTLIQETISRYGHVDTLVNNAGVNFVKPTLEMDESDWDRVINVDLKGTFLCSRYALEAMVPRRQGSIVNIASVHTLATLPEAAPYAASKGGVEMMTKSLAIEFAPHGIRVNAVSPGLTDTQIWQDIQDAAEDPEEARRHWYDNIPMGRVQSTREVANVVLFLASDQSSYVTGANIMSDGGMTSQLISQARYASKALEGKIDR
jgi:NAD(P)-dependent dehydrogenase (short-subunit alcohol dehydrogenase family)